MKGNGSDDYLFHVAAGVIGSILLGAALVPLREMTTASNLTFAFLVLTIVTAELGGGWAALATAVSSTLSLDFFLTRPFLSLAIHDKNDLIAFLGLATCGLVTAALASRRREGLAARRHLAALRASTVQLELAGPGQSRLERLLEAAWRAFPVSHLTVRDPRDRALAAYGRTGSASPPPSRVVEAERLSSLDEPAFNWSGTAPPLPTEGLRVLLVFRNQNVGWLDVWGDGTPASVDSRLALGAIARVAAVLIAEPPSPSPLP